MKIILITLLMCLSGVLSEEPVALCRTDVPAKENFSPAFYTGIWFEHFFSDPEFEGECVNHHYTRRGLNQIFDVESTFVFGTEFRRLQMVVSIAFPDEIPMRAILNGTLIVGEDAFDYVYQVYATDYTNYSIVWACHVENDEPIETVAIFGRSANAFSESVLDKIDSLLGQIGISRENLRPISHEEEVCLPEQPPAPED